MNAYKLKENFKKYEALQEFHNDCAEMFRLSGNKIQERKARYDAEKAGRMADTYKKGIEYDKRGENVYI